MNTYSKGLLILALFIFGVFGYYYETGLPRLVMLLLGVFIGGFSYVLFEFLFRFLGKWIKKIPLAINAAILGILATLFLAKGLGFRMADQVYYLGTIALALLILLFVFSLKKLQKTNLAWLGILLPIILVLWGGAWLLGEGSDPFGEDLPPPFVPKNIRLLSSTGLSNPIEFGRFNVQQFTYGNGRDKHRKEYAAGIKLKTPQVNASLLLPEWKGKKKKWRERYWDFGTKNFPLNGRVYMPEGKGPFPLVLIVHGNHSMIDYSDEGYGYLGELLASRGIIMVSVDENFINGHWSGDFRGREMPTRAWLLLKHLEQWRKWNSSSDHELFGRIDMENIMLIGHSRGGEAVSIAAAYNQLTHFPDNALERFDFNFKIKGIVSIAPTDYRYHRQIKLENLNYLSLQGAYDADEVSFWGMRPFRRLKFTDGKDWFKAGVYIHRANHGQFNSTWGRSDFGPPGGWLLNRRPLLTGEDQRQIAKVFISAFAEAVLKGNKDYLLLFSNVNTGRDWLPENYYLTHYQNNRDQIIQDFEEDINLTSGKDSILISSQNLKIWREENLRTRNRGSQQNNTVVLGWDYGEKIKLDSLASYSLFLSDSTLAAIDSTSHLLISIAAGNYKELERLRNKEAQKEKIKEPQLDFHIVLTDHNGSQAKIAVQDIKGIAPQLKSRFMKLESLSKNIGEAWEIHLELFALPLSKFEFSTESFDIKRLKEIRLIFDICTYGVVVVDDIGFGIR